MYQINKALKGDKYVSPFLSQATSAAVKAVDIYKTSQKSFDALKTSQKGLYGLTATNGFSEAITGSEILLEFSLNDWGELSNQVLSKPIEWQRKIAYCLENECNEYELNILMTLLNTNDTELFEICIDTLRSYSSEENKKMILDNPQILKRVNDLLSTANPPVRTILQDFLSKIY
ncbi:hypothetical protein QUF51_05365 [Bacillus pumilus]|nr:hypothetical protein [Bacillus pumilus]